MQVYNSLIIMGIFGFLTEPFRRLERKMAETKAELQAQLAEVQGKLDATYSDLSQTIANEASEIKAVVTTLEAKILQLQNQPTIPVDYNVDLSALKASVDRFNDLSKNIGDLVQAPVGIDPVPEEIPTPVAPPVSGNLPLVAPEGSEQPSVIVEPAGEVPEAEADTDEL
jgi:hypothetical protein